MGYKSIEEEFELSADNLKNVIALLEEYATQFETVYKRKLKDDKRIASGRLYRSVKCTVKIMGQYLKVEFNAAEYYKWLENGRPPTRNGGDGSVRRKILEWVKIKGITGRPDPDSGRLPTQEQLAYAITNKIHQYGYRGGNYLKETRDELGEGFILSALQDALQRDFEEAYEVKIFNDINKKLEKLF